MKLTAVVIGLVLCAAPVQAQTPAAWGWGNEKAAAPGAPAPTAKKPAAAKAAKKAPAVTKTSGQTHATPVEAAAQSTPIESTSVEASEVLTPQATEIARVTPPAIPDAASVEAMLSEPTPVDSTPIAPMAPVEIVPAPAAPPAAADAGDAPAPAPWIHGFASMGYSINFNGPASKQNQLRVFDFDDQRMKLDVAELIVERPAAAPGSFGFRTAFVTGNSVPQISAASGLFRDPATGVFSAGNVDVQQMYASYVAPLGKGLKIDAGKFTTHAGAELIEGFDGYNDNYTRSILFGYAIPFTHTGVRAAYQVNSVVSVLGMVVNGWDNFKDNNDRKSIGAQLAVTPVKPLTISFNYLGGPERTDSRDARQLYDVVVVLKPRDTVALTVNYDQARETNGVDGQDSSWRGVAGGARFDLSAVWSVAFRGEMFADPDGVRTGTSQTLAEFTVTPGVKVSSHVIVRGDIRYDHSTQTPFETASGSANHQSTAAINAVFVF